MDIRNPFATLASAGFVFDLSIPRATSFRAFDNIHHLDCDEWFINPKTVKALKVSYSSIILTAGHSASHAKERINTKKKITESYNPL